MRYGDITLKRDGLTSIIFLLHIVLCIIKKISKAIEALGYFGKYGVYQIDDSMLGNPIEVYELLSDSKLPRYLIEYCPVGAKVDYFVAYDMPSLIELLNKLAPLVHAAVACNQINDIAENLKTESDS